MKKAQPAKPAPKAKPAAKATPAAKPAPARPVSAKAAPGTTSTKR